MRRMELCDVVGLDQVVMVKSHVERGDEPIENARPQFEVQATAQLVESVIVVAEAKLGVVIQSDAGLAAHALVTHHLVYSLQGDGGRWSAADLQRFADTTAVFNVWPFWRQHLHAMFGAMALPVPLLPSYVLSPATLRAQQS